MSAAPGDRPKLTTGISIRPERANCTIDPAMLGTMIREDVRPRRTRERRAVKLTAALAAITLAVIGVAIAEVVGHAGQTPSATGAHRTSDRTSVRRTSPSAGATPSTSTSPSAAATPSGTGSPSGTASTAAQVQALRPVTVTAYGPGGATGDDAAGAANVLAGAGAGTGAVWQSDWYTTPQFGGLQTGTGLLVAMSHSVTISSVAVTLGSEPGAVFQVQAGPRASAAGMTTLGTSSGAAGTVQVTLAKPVLARYVLIWFTTLPPDGAGTYQIKVYGLTVRGQD